MVVLVCCDVGSTRGIGHFMRCLALAEEFVLRGARVLFSADVDEVPFALQQLEERGLTHRPAGHRVDDFVTMLDEETPDIVVIDSYTLPVEVYDAVSRRARTIAIVDGDPAGRRAQFYLDQNLDAELARWPLPDGAVRLAGLDYALMRTELLEARERRVDTVVHDTPAVFAFFGGTDAMGVAPLAARALIDTGLPLRARVVAATAQLRSELESMVAGPDQHLEVIAPTSRLAEEILAADVVIAAAGTSSWELLCLEAACVFVPVADNQLPAYRRMIDSGAALGAGTLDEVRKDPGLLAASMRTVLMDQGLRQQLRGRGGGMVDGLGRTRVVDRVVTETAR